jgi:hypothetical protein
MTEFRKGSHEESEWRHACIDAVEGESLELWKQWLDHQIFGTFRENVTEVEQASGTVCQERASVLVIRTCDVIGIIDGKCDEIWRINLAE